MASRYVDQGKPSAGADPGVGQGEGHKAGQVISGWRTY